MSRAHMNDPFSPVSVTYTVVLPNQLYYPNPIIQPEFPVLIVIFPEFEQANFHKLKIATMRARVYAYCAFLRSRQIAAHVIEPENISSVYDTIKNCTINIADPVDNSVETYLQRFRNVKFHENSGFLITKDEISAYVEREKLTKFDDFYAENIDKIGGNIGNISSKAENTSLKTEDMSKTEDITDVSATFQRVFQHVSNETQPLEYVLTTSGDRVFTRASAFVNEKYSKNYGVLGKIRYPITREEAMDWLKIFIKSRLPFFRDSEMSVSRSLPFTNHSAIGTCLNSGLITPTEIVREITASSVDSTIKSQFLRGLLRREYMRLIYRFPGMNYVDASRVPRQGANIFAHRRNLSINWYDGSTGFGIVDSTISDVKNYAYTHDAGRHIVSSLMLLCRVEPRQVYEWFLSNFTDSYPWCTAPNTLNISQYCYKISVPYSADLISPSIFSAPIIEKIFYMGKQDRWIKRWDTLVVAFLLGNADVLRKLPHLSALVKTYLKRKNDSRDRTIKEATTIINAI